MAETVDSLAWESTRLIACPEPRSTSVTDGAGTPATSFERLRLRCGFALPAMQGSGRTSNAEQEETDAVSTGGEPGLRRDRYRQGPALCGGRNRFVWRAQVGRCSAAIRNCEPEGLPAATPAQQCARHRRDTLERSQEGAGGGGNAACSDVLHNAGIWQRCVREPFAKRLQTVLNGLLNGFEGKLMARQWSVSCQRQVTPGAVSLTHEGASVRSAGLSRDARSVLRSSRRKSAPRASLHARPAAAGSSLRASSRCDREGVQAGPA